MRKWLDRGLVSAQPELTRCYTSMTREAAKTKGFLFLHHNLEIGSVLHLGLTTQQVGMLQRLFRAPVSHEENVQGYGSSITFSAVILSLLSYVTSPATKSRASSVALGRISVHLFRGYS